MKAAQDRHKSYANTRWRPLKFHERDKMFLKACILEFGGQLGRSCMHKNNHMRILEFMWNS